MNNLIEQNFAVFFPLFFASLWLAVTTILAVLSGWFRLMAKFPNQTESPLLRIRGQSGSMGSIGGVSMHGILTLGVCPSGLRIRIMRVFGPFCRDFFVPWEVIRITRKTVLFWPVAKLQFGMPSVGSLTIPAHVANRLAFVGLWPETGPFPQETHRDTLRRLLTQWALITCAAALFFTLVPLAVAPTGGRHYRSASDFSDHAGNEH